ncbi:MAG: S24 family peptidase [Ruminococcus bromii]|nr:S24 family peptidase [Ruminococcus bromii]
MYFSNDIAIKIKNLAKEKKCKLSDMFIEIGIGKNTMANLKTSMPKADTLAKIADYLDCSVDYLLGRTDNPQFVKSSKKTLIDFQNSNKTVIKTILLPLYRTPASAGTGSWLLDDTPIEYTNVPKNDITCITDFMIEVRGDSMQPKFFDGDFILIKKQDSIYEDEIGVFIINGESYIKKMGRNELISLNPAYNPIKLNEFDNIFCVGKVLGKLDLQ